jgi:GT2 family glycosyltransferase
MTHPAVKVAVVVPVHNRKPLTLQCLNSLRRIDRSDLELEIYVVDDGSTDGTSEAIAEQFPDVNVIEGDGDLWFTEGTNVGVRAALEHDPDFVLMINDDQVFDENSLKYMAETANRFGRAVVGPLLLLWDTPHKLFQTAPVWSTSHGGWRHWYEQTVWTVPDKPWEVDIIVGNCVLVPAQAFREAGLMDAKRFPNFGDAEFTPRLKRQGWKLLIDPRARVFCQPNDLPPRVRDMGPRRMFNALAVDLKNTHNLRRRFYANLAGAPSKWQGVAAFAMFMLRAIVGKGSDAAGQKHHEPLLKDRFADAIAADDEPEKMER